MTPSTFPSKWRTGLVCAFLALLFHAALVLAGHPAAALPVNDDQRATTMMLLLALGFRPEALSPETTLPAAGPQDDDVQPSAGAVSPAARPAGKGGEAAVRAGGNGSWLLHVPDGNAEPMP
ncbi:MAG: hypothetical protein KDG54_04655 [Geminicoccaceae bacterium]|nr:hypothetical protein [Geminicoccaceae bacterium]